MLVDVPQGCSTTPLLAVELRQSLGCSEFTWGSPGMALGHLEVQEVSGGWALLPGVWRFTL